MSIHIGKIIHELVKEKRLKARFVGKEINVSESNVYKIYKQKTIDVDKLIIFSQVLNTNLFLHYLRAEPLKSMFNQKTEDLKSEIKILNNTIAQRDKRIKELEDITSSQQKVISLLEKNK